MQCFNCLLLSDWLLLGDLKYLFGLFGLSTSTLTPWPSIATNVFNFVFFVILFSQLRCFFSLELLFFCFYCCWYCLIDCCWSFPYPYRQFPSLVGVVTPVFHLVFLFLFCFFVAWLILVVSLTVVVTPASPAPLTSHCPTPILCCAYTLWHIPTIPYHTNHTNHTIGMIPTIAPTYQTTIVWKEAKAASNNKHQQSTGTNIPTNPKQAKIDCTVWVILIKDTQLFANFCNPAPWQRFFWKWYPLQKQVGLDRSTGRDLFEAVGNYFCLVLIRQQTRWSRLLENFQLFRIQRSVRSKGGLLSSLITCCRAACRAYRDT